MTRPIIVVDCETNGLDPTRHYAIEVAWEFLDGSDRGLFIPAHRTGEILGAASVEALRVNRYIDRIAGQPQDGHLDRDAMTAVGEGGFRLWRAFLSVEGGCALAGSNPGFDARFLRKLFAAGYDLTADEPEPWHHRMWDLSAYAAGVLGLDELPGLAKVCGLLEVQPGDHTAQGDVEATVKCFRELRARATAKVAA